MLRAYKYRMYPSQEQVASLMQHIHACRFVYNKAIQKLARCHEKVSNQRNDFLHKLSNRVVGENQAIAVESLNVSGMQKNHCLAQSISDVSWSAFFTMLEYKCQMHGKTLSKIGRFDPSSKICSTCGYLNRDLARKDREWICPDCGTHHDRDINAAINIKKFALQDQNLVGVSGAKRAEGPVDSLPMGRGMITGKPRPQARGSSRFRMWQPHSLIVLCADCANRHPIYRSSGIAHQLTDVFQYLAKLIEIVFWKPTHRFPVLGCC
ncbi:MAG: IS200/IS605 family element transposase accessory protein TnpB [Methanoculleus sp.]|nr:IS200/IS605 family element transposase accessory protein TnpB [Methanoculleus sp.]